MFLVVAVTVSVLVDVAARRQAAAARSEAEADMLGRAVSEPLTQRTPEEVLAEVAATFRLTSVALVEGERQTVLARVGPDSRDPVTLQVPAGGDRLLIGAGRERLRRGPPTPGEPRPRRRPLVDVRALATEAERARILAEVDTVRTALPPAAVGHDLRTHSLESRQPSPPFANPTSTSTRRTAMSCSPRSRTPPIGSPT